MTDFKSTADIGQRSFTFFNLAGYKFRAEWLREDEWHITRITSDPAEIGGADWSATEIDNLDMEGERSLIGTYWIGVAIED